MEEDLLPKLGLSLPRIDEGSGEECFTYVKNKSKKMLQLKTLQSKLTPESGLISTTAQMNQILTAILEHVQANEENISDSDSGYHLLPGFGFGAQVAYGVEPQRGAVLMFPQGNTASLVHEGSAVRGDVRKYVIRSDVLLEVPLGGRER